jgi:hypothetical protein
MTNIHAKAELDRLQHNLRVKLSRDIATNEIRKRTQEEWEEYLRNDPDSTRVSINALLSEHDPLPLSDQVTIGDEVTPPWAIILTQRISELNSAAKGLPGAERLACICYGTIPGGGLDAFAFKANGAEEYGIAVPDGLFNLINLFTRLVILLQPLTQTKDGPMYFPSANFAQYALISHPYISFRHRDVLSAYLLWGNPEAALLYTSAVPFQDRFGYLLAGTELFVLAHEAAHVMLGHLDAEGILQSSVKRELEADALAILILKNHFTSFTDVPDLRANLCAFFFLSLDQMWQRAVSTAINPGGKYLSLSSHPGAKERFENLAAQLTDNTSSTPAWYGFVFNAIKLATESITESAITASTTNHSIDVSSLNARVLPASYMAYGSLRVPDDNQWSMRVAELILSEDQNDRRMGLWFLSDLGGYSIAERLYRGITSDDEHFQSLCKRTLVSVEPLYESYMPRLIERFRETEQQDELDSYIHGIASQLIMSAMMELGDERSPMDHGFFDS